MVLSKIFKRRKATPKGPSLSKSPSKKRTSPARKKAAEDIAKELSNPTAALAGIGSNLDFQAFEGNGSVASTIAGPVSDQ